MNEAKKKCVATALSILFAMSVITTNVYAASDNTPPGDPPGGSMMGEPPGDPPD